MISTQVRSQIEQMIAGFEDAKAAGENISPSVHAVVEGARAALSCTDAKWLARAATEDARSVCLLAAHGDLAGNYKLI